MIKYELKMTGGRSHTSGGITFERGVWVPVARSVWEELKLDTRFENRSRFVEGKAKPVIEGAEPEIKEPEKPAPIPVFETTLIVAHGKASLEQMKRAELLDLSASYGLNLSDKLSRAALIAAISEHQEKQR